MGTIFQNERPCSCIPRPRWSAASRTTSHSAWAEGSTILIRIRKPAARFLADPDCLFFAGNHPSGRYVNRATLQASAPTIEGEAYQFTLRVFRQYARGLRNEGQPQLDRAARPRFAVRPEDGERATMRAMMRRMVNETAAMQNRLG